MTMHSYVKMFLEFATKIAKYLFAVLFSRDCLHLFLLWYLILWKLCGTVKMVLEFATKIVNYFFAGVLASISRKVVNFQRITYNL